MTLHDGYMQQIPRDNLGELTRLYFRTDLVRVRGVGNRFEQTEKDDYKSEREMSVCEMAKGLEDGNQELEQARTTLANTLAAATHYPGDGRAAAARQGREAEAAAHGRRACTASSLMPMFGNAAIADSDHDGARCDHCESRRARVVRSGGLPRARHRPRAASHDASGRRSRAATPRQRRSTHSADRNREPRLLGCPAATHGAGVRGRPRTRRKGSAQ